MKKLIIASALATSLIGALVPLSASATTVPGWTGQSAYQAIMCYTTGSYWASQKAAYPAYYAANNAYYLAAYGPGTIYCP